MEESKGFSNDELNRIENTPIIENGQNHSHDSKNEAIKSPVSSENQPSKNVPLFWKERKSLKIRYTRQYLLDRKYDPLSTTFPNCLLKFLQSGEVPLKETENCCEYRSMDHILFYSSLPYTRVRNSLNIVVKREPFKLCY